jgi:hypothetical protein
MVAHPHWASPKSVRQWAPLRDLVQSLSDAQPHWYFPGWVWTHAVPKSKPIMVQFWHDAPPAGHAVALAATQFIPLQQ